jgi:hypothetical protein
MSMSRKPYPSDVSDCASLIRGAFLGWRVKLDRSGWTPRPGCWADGLHFRSMRLARKTLVPGRFAADTLLASARLGRPPDTPLVKRPSCTAALRPRIERPRLRRHIEAATKSRDDRCAATLGHRSKDSKTTAPRCPQALLRAIDRAASITSIRARLTLAPALTSLRQYSIARRAALSAASSSSPE